MTPQLLATETAIEQLEAHWLWFVRHERKEKEIDLALFVRFLPDFRVSVALRTLEQRMLHVCRNRATNYPKENADLPPAILSPVQSQLWLIWRLAKPGPNPVPVSNKHEISMDELMRQIDAVS